MTQAELDAIFRAWRDEYFAANPKAVIWRGSIYRLCRGLPSSLDAADISKLVNRAQDAGELSWEPEEAHYITRRPEEPLSFPDPPPLPASAPIPFPAGKALLEESPKVFSIGARVSCDKHAPEWDWDCDDCTWT